MADGESHYGFIALGSEEGLAAMMSPDPQPTYVELAGKCPVLHNADGSVTLLRMADVQVVTRSHEVLGNGALGPGMGGARPLIPLDLDGPEHTKYRKLLDPLFAPRKVAPLEAQVRRLTDDLIDGFIDRGEVDVFEELCQPLPSTIFLTLMGIPLTELNRFLEFKDGVLKGDPNMDMEARMAQVQAASKTCYDYFNGVLDEREARADPGDDLIGWFMTAEVDGHTLSRENILDITYLLMIAGLDTVGASLACLIHWLARNPDRRRQLVAQPELWPNAVEELMRFESPVSTGYRMPTQDVEAGGETIKAGTLTIVSWSAANLDPDVFDDPLEVDFSRAPNPHIAFASGFHRCLGSHLARMELRSALDQFHRRIPDYEIKPGHDVVFMPNPRTPVNGLPIVWN